MAVRSRRRTSAPGWERPFEALARIIHDGSSRKHRVTWRDRRAEPEGPDAYSCSTLRGARRDEERAPRLCAPPSR